MTNDELLEVIERAAAKGAQELDLSNQDLEGLPPEIAKLTHI